MFSAKEAAIAVDVARKTGLPIAVNLTYKYTKDRDTGNTVSRTDWGDTAASLLEALSSDAVSDGDDLLDDVQIVGLHCGAEVSRSEHTGLPYAVNGIRQIRETMDAKGIEPKLMMAYPNAGLPNAFGQYDELPDETGALLGEFATSGFVNIVGGCCGTTPDHIRAIAKAVDGVDPRRVPARATCASRFSGLETLTVRDDSNFLVVGERTNVTGSKRFARLIKSDDVTAATEVAVDQVRGELGPKTGQTLLQLVAAKATQHLQGVILLGEARGVVWSESIDPQGGQEHRQGQPAPRTDGGDELAG